MSAAEARTAAVQEQEGVTDQAVRAFLAGESFFLTGPAGTGKTTLVKTFKSLSYKMHKQCAVTASTGKAAFQLGPECEAKTIHSWSAFNYFDESEPFATTLERVRKNRMAVANFKNTDILIIDEVSMLHPAFLDRLHEVACALNRTPAPMGGIQLVLVGDLYQLPCVSKGPELFCFHAKHWPLLVPRIFHLEKVFRQTDHELINVLNDIRVGNITQHVLDYLSSIPSDVPDESQYTFIYPRLHQVAEHNSRRLSELPGAESNYKARLIDTTPGEFQNKRQFGPATFPKDTVIPEELVVKPGALVMLIVNIDVAKGLINGTQGLVLSCSPSIVSVVFAIQPTAPLSYPPSNTWDPLCYTILNLTRNRFVISRWLTVEQFPITLAFALTVHKAQGSSLAKVCVDIGDSVFATGQAYVALSRCICPELLRIKSFHPDSIKASTAVCEFYSKSAPPPATAAAVVSQDDPAENEQEEASL